MTSPSARVLVADDNSLNRELLSQLLEELGYEVDLVVDGLAAVEAVSSTRYAIIFMDCEMPELGGYDAARRIRAAEAERRVPIVAVTAHDPLSQRDQVRDADMDGCLAKPIDEDALGVLLTRFAPRDDAPVEAFTREVSPKVRALFFKLVPGQIDSIVDAAGFDDRTRAAHKLKGSCLAVGALRMAEACKQLEGESEAETVVELVAELRARFRSLRS